MLRTLQGLDDRPFDQPRALTDPRGRPLPSRPDAAQRFPKLAPLPEARATHQLVLDGELVAFDAGRPSFGRKLSS